MGVVLGTTAPSPPAGAASDGLPPPVSGVVPWVASAVWPLSASAVTLPPPPPEALPPAPLPVPPVPIEPPAPAPPVPVVPPVAAGLDLPPLPLPPEPSLDEPPPEGDMALAHPAAIQAESRPSTSL